MLSYRGIPGWFDFEDVYAEAVARAPVDRPSYFVEVGALFGASSRCMVDLIKASKKQIWLDVVDLFPEKFTAPKAEKQREITDRHGGCLAAFNHYTGGFKDYDQVRVHKMHSTEFIKMMGEGYITIPAKFDFVFLDGGHTYENVSAEIKGFLPIMRKGAIIGGHDYANNDWPGVKQAVDEAFGSTVKKKGNSWLKYL